MRLKTPSFWYQEKSIPACFLKPAAALYLCAHKYKASRAHTYKSTVPVICVGNITAGGSGKTPSALALFDLVNTLSPDTKICFLTRGYGGSLKNATEVDGQNHTAADVGDEALLLSCKAPTIVSADRAAGAKLAEQKGYDLIIMDDGMQNASLHKDITILVIDGEKGFGNAQALPAGPLREPIANGLDKSDIVLIIGEHKNVPSEVKSKAVMTATIRADKSDLEFSRYVAFAGLAHPDKFKTTLENAGIEIAAWRPYPDHYAYKERDIVQLRALSKEQQAPLITTAKDAVRLPKDLDVSVLPITLVFDETQPLETKIKTILNA